MPKIRRRRPHKPKSCVTCKRRFKPCDKANPSCLQCISEGIICGGYEASNQQLIWANATQTTMAYSLSDFYLSQEVTPSPSEPLLNKAHTETPVTENIHILHDTLATSAREQRFLGMFISSALPNGHFLSSQASKLSKNDWMAAIETFYDKEPSIRHATLAMSTGIISAVGYNAELWAQSLKAYKQSIKELRKTLKDRKRSRGEGVIVAIRTLQLYELLFGSANSWRIHLEGQLAMFLARGPQAFTSGQAHQLYVDGRIYVVILSLAKRVKSPLCTQEWRTIPWTHNQRSPKDKLLDIVEDILEILVNQDYLCACRNPGDVDLFRKMILSSCQNVEDSLDSWEKEVGLNLTTFDYLATKLPLPTPQPTLDFGLLHISNLYWAVRLMLYTIVEQVENFSLSTTRNETQIQELTGMPTPPAASPAAFSSPLKKAIKVNPKFYADKIAHSMYRFFNSKTGVIQVASALFPMAMAMRFYANSEVDGKQSREYQMLSTLFDQPFLRSFARQFVEEVEMRNRDTSGLFQSDAQMTQRSMWWYQVMGSSSSPQ